jgi:hypothetical protein
VNPFNGNRLRRCLLLAPLCATIGLAILDLRFGLDWDWSGKVWLAGVVSALLSCGVAFAVAIRTRLARFFFAGYLSLSLLFFWAAVFVVASVHARA